MFGYGLVQRRGRNFITTNRSRFLSNAKLKGDVSGLKKRPESRQKHENPPQSRDL